MGLGEGGFIAEQAMTLARSQISRTFEDPPHTSTTTRFATHGSTRAQSIQSLRKGKNIMFRGVVHI